MDKKFSKDKIILAYYIEVGNLDNDDVGEFISNISESLSDENMIQYFIPIRGDEKSRIECVYPKYILKEDLEEDLEIDLEEKFESVIKKLDSYLDNLTNEK